MENKGILLKSAMSYGLAMGVYWVVKYLFFIFGTSSPSLMFLYEVGSLAVPVLAYYWTDCYRRDVGGRMSFGHAWQFGVLLYFFAALIVSLEHYVFYKYIASPDFLSNAMEQAKRLLEAADAKADMLKAVDEIRLTPVHMAIQGIFNNVFYGIILSVPVAALVCRKRSGEEIKQDKN